MQPSAPGGSQSAVPWSEVLVRVQAAVERAVAEATARARRLDAAGESPVPPATGSQQAMQQAVQRCQALGARADGAAARVAEVDAALAEAEEALRQWLRATEAAREKLAAWVGRAVG
jgi:hypothetical protein